MRAVAEYSIAARARSGVRMIPKSLVIALWSKYANILLA
jgi:hypothetical protein